MLLLKASIGIDDVDVEGNSALHWCLKASKASSLPEIKSPSPSLTHSHTDTDTHVHTFTRQALRCRKKERTCKIQN